MPDGADRPSTSALDPGDRGRRVELGADPGEELIPGERLGEELVLRRLGLAGRAEVSGQGEDPGRRAPIAEAPRKLLAAHARHDEIGEEEIDAAGVALGEGEGLLAAGRLQDRGAGLLDDGAGGGAHTP